MAKTSAKKQVGLSKKSLGNFSLVKNAQKGIGVELAFEVADALLMPYKELSQILQLSTKTLRSYQKENKSLNPIASEQILKLNELRIRGEEVFGTIDAFSKWLKKPAFGLADEVPSAVIMQEKVYLINTNHIDFREKKIRLVNLEDFIFNPRIKSENPGRIE